MSTPYINEFMELFRGSEKGYGRSDADGGRIKFITTQVKEKQYIDHLKGKVAIGIVPTNDQGLSWYGALDFDNHKGVNSTTMDIVALSIKIKELGLPMVLCRSRRGGAHGYIFGSEPLSSTVLVQVLKHLKKQLKGFGEADIEVFPKQTHLTKAAQGNFLFLPYFDSESTQRYALLDGDIINIAKFTAEAARLKVDNDQLRDLIALDHSDDEAPPCIQTMLTENLGQGSRNDALFSYAVYAKKAYSDDWKQKVHDFNANNFEMSLGQEEVRALITSQATKSYGFKCSVEPCVSRCNRKLCVKRKFGITNHEKDQLDAAEMPALTNLVKIDIDPVEWQLSIDGVKVMFTTEQLMTFRLFKHRVFEKMTRVIADVKANDWMVMLSKLTEDVVVEEAPVDADQKGIIRAHFLIFAKKHNLQSPGTDMKDRESLQRGKGCVQVYQGERFLYFKSTTLHKFLQSKKLGNIGINKIFLALRDLNVSHRVVRIGKDTENCWTYPVGNITDIDTTPEPFKINY